jgi:hypothetical protein
VRASNPPVKEHPYFARLIAPLLNRVNEPDDEKDPEEAMGLEEELKELREASQSQKDAPQKVQVVGKGMGGKGVPGGGGSGAGGDVGQVVVDGK